MNYNPYCAVSFFQSSAIIHSSKITSKTCTGVIRRTLIASKILELSAPQNSKEANNIKIPLKTIEIGLAKEYVYVGDVCKTLSIYVDANWEGIPHDP